MRRFLIFAAFGVLILILKLFAYAVVYVGGPILALTIILACIAIAHIIENRAARPE